jgi:methionine-S-sulfoxide reductase
MNKTAVFAGGCFWCMEPPYAKIPGVTKVLPGYTGGQTENPTYEQVCAGGTGHYEAVEVTYDPDIVSFEQLLEVFWRQIDPTDAFGQFADRGRPRSIRPKAATANTTRRTPAITRGIRQARGARHTSTACGARKRLKKGCRLCSIA